jgi:hypothetical protein
LGATTSDITIAGIQGVKYVYILENIPQVDVDLPFGQYKIILGAHKEYEDIFNQILASFKFIQ